jgi:hypothetical protein
MLVRRAKDDRGDILGVLGADDQKWAVAEKKTLNGSPGMP